MYMLLYLHVHSFIPHVINMPCVKELSHIYHAIEISHVIKISHAIEIFHAIKISHVKVIHVPHTLFVFFFNFR